MHISKQFDAELDHVRRLLCAMGRLVGRQLSAALTCLERRDASLATRVVVGEREVNSMESGLDEICASVLARRQPASSDLRFLVSALKAIVDLERVGDEAGKIAFVSGRNPSLPLPPEIRSMGRLALGMLDRSLTIFEHMDMAGALDLAHRDLELDALFASALQRLLGCMIEDPRTIAGALDAIFVARSLERIGDHACNLSEHVVYVMSGRHVRHLSMEEIRKVVESGRD